MITNPWDERPEIIKSVLMAAYSLLSVMIISSYLYENSFLTSTLLVVSFIPLAAYWKDYQEIMIIIPLSILAALVELFCVNSGVWTYANPDILGIPYWLPFGWAHVLYSLYKLSEAIHS
jgi:hypothetical protein